MKNLTYLLLISIMGLIFTGCGASAPKPMLVKKLEQGSYLVAGTTDRDWDKTSPIHNIAAALQMSADWTKEGFPKYTRIGFGPQSSVPPMITNFKDLVDYCYPSNNGGYRIEDLNAKNSSLENKCNLNSRDSNKNDVIVVFTKYHKPSVNSYRWDLDQVRSDPLVQKFVDEALKTYDDKNLRTIRK